MTPLMALYRSVCLLVFFLALLTPDLSAKRPPKPGKRTVSLLKSIEFVVQVVQNLGMNHV